jgi:hypothetical protein
MEPFSDEILSILVLIAVILAGVTFIAVTILIICLLCFRYRHSATVSPVDSHSITPTDSRRSSVSSVSSAITSIPIKSPVVKSTRRQEQRSPSNSISIIDERSYDNRKKHSQVYSYDDTTIRNESRVYSQRRQQHQKPTTDVRFIDRATPYPPDVIARERVMMAHLRIPRNNKHHQ